MNLPSPPVSDLYTLLYHSRAVRPLDERDLLLLLMSSMRHNTRIGVTGLLLYGPPAPLPEPDESTPPPTAVVPFEGNGAFVQWLEGPESTVRATYDRIARDDRHTDLELLHTAPSDERLFPYWAMSLETTQALPRTPAEIERIAEQRHQPIDQ